MRRHTLLLVLLASATPLTVHAEDVQSILQKMQQLQLERWEGVNTYVVVQKLMGQQVTMGFERTEVQGPDGKPYPVFQPIRQGATDPDSVAFLEAYADGAEMVGEGLGSEIDRGMEQAGLPKGLLKATGGDPWASLDPRVMMGGASTFARAAAAGPDTKPESPEASAAASRDAMADFAQRAKLLGIEEVEGRKAFHLFADGLDQVQQADGQEFKLDTLNMWIDTREYVPLRMKIEGIATSAEGSRPIELERISADYRTVPGSSMYESYRQVMRMGGMMTPQQQKEMQEAQKQMADLDRQLASMPPSQRDMLMRQMGPQMEMMRSMAASGSMEMVTEVHEILVNPDAAALQQLRGGSIGALAGQRPSAAIQAPSLTPVAGTNVAATAPASVDDPAALHAAQQACLKEKMEQAQQSQEKKRGFGRLLGAAGRIAGRFGGADVSQTMGDVYTANATADDLAAAAKDLGLSESDIESCKNPG